MPDITNLNAAQTAELARNVARTEFGTALPPASAEAAAYVKGQAEATKNSFNAVFDTVYLPLVGGNANVKIPISQIENSAPGAFGQLQALLPQGYTLPPAISVNDLSKVTNSVLDSVIQQSTTGTTRPVASTAPTTTNPQSTVPAPRVFPPPPPASAKSRSSGVSSFVKNIAKETINNFLGGGPNGVGDSNPKSLKSGTVQDWTHATKVFVGGDMIRAPKYKGLFHVNFVINNDAFSAGLDPLKGDVRDTLSVLTKSIELPKFNMEYSSLNQYNHTSYNYKKIKYDPVTVTFHDDMADIVTTFWYFYYAYYFADGSKTYDSKEAGGAGSGGGGLFAGLVDKAKKAITGAITGGLKKLLGKKDSNGNKTEGTPPATEAKEPYEAFRKYANGIMYGDKGEKKITDLHYSWGLNGSGYHVAGGREKNVPFLRAIEIYPLGNKKASMIVLHNPKIVSWAGDTFDYSAQGTATCTATIVYEGVTYKDQIDAKTILDDVQMYDRHGAPGSGKTGGLFSFIDKVDGILGKAARGDRLTGGDIITGLGAVKGLLRGGGG